MLLFFKKSASLLPENALIYYNQNMQIQRSYFGKELFQYYKIKNEIKNKIVKLLKIKIK